jgi:hypothetical protein
MPDHDAAAAVEGRDTRVAWLLAVAAIVAALIGTWAAILAAEASVSWQDAAVQEVHAGSLRIVFGTAAYNAGAAALDAQRTEAEASNLAAAGRAYDIPAARAEGAALRKSVLVDPGLTMMSAASGQSPDSYDPKVAVASLEKQLAAAKNQPEALQREGDRASRRAVRMSAAAVLGAIAFLLAALARAETRRRPLLLGASLGVLALAVVGALAIGIVI